MSHGNTTHGQSESRLYRIWAGMKTRCTNLNRDVTKCYVGRGISLFPEWHYFEPFRDWAINNGYSGKLSIERKDVNGDYEPNNCCWIPLPQQARNTRNTTPVVAFGESKLASDWVLDPRCRCTAFAIYKRISRGWKAEEAISTPLRKTVPAATAFGEHKTLDEWAKDPRAGASRSAIDQRLRNGWSPEEAIVTPARETRPFGLVTAFGETKLAYEWAKDYRTKVTYETMVARLKRGWNPEQAMIAPLKFGRHSE